jgi:hypothetical protein
LDYDNRLESVANAHTAADLHVRPVLKPRWSYDRRRREQFRNTRCVATRNAFDSTSERLIAAHLAHGSGRVSVTRKQVFESARKIAHPKCAVINDGELQKIFTNPSSNSLEDDFSKRFISLCR